MTDFPLNLCDNNERSAWYQGRLWLSLDRFERFWPDVGLTLANGTAVKFAIRSALRVEYAINADFRARFAADPDCDDDLYHIDRLEALAKVCFRQINETAGTQDAECSARWLTGPVLGAIAEWNVPEHQWHNRWSALLYHMWELDPREIESSYGIPAHTVQRIAEIAARFRSEKDANRERVEAADQEPLSGWDAIAYADYRWECPEPSPLDGLILHLRYISFDRAWADVICCTRASDMDALVEWGRAYIAAHMSSVQEWEAIIPDDVRAAWSDLHVQAA